MTRWQAAERGWSGQGINLGGGGEGGGGGGEGGGLLTSTSIQQVSSSFSIERGYGEKDGGHVAGCTEAMVNFALQQFEHAIGKALCILLSTHNY